MKWVCHAVLVATCRVLNMSTSSLYKYFNKIDRDCQRNSPLPDPDGQLSSKVPSSSIISANNEVKMALTATRKRGMYD